MQFGKCSLIIFTIICSIKAQGQSNPDFIPQVVPNAPNSSSIAKFGNYKVSYFTGLPDISIPLYEIKVGQLNIPISLSYHSSGIQVTQSASWVGLGWSLSTGAGITRRIMGNGPDENGDGYLHQPITDANTIDLNTASGISFMDGLSTLRKDFEPDVFSYSLNDNEGKFFFNGVNNFQVTPIPYSPVAIKYTSSPSQLKFNITDANGINYRFGSNKEVSTTTNGGVDRPVTSAWMIDTVISTDRQDTISYAYTYQSAVTLHDFSETWRIDDDVTYIVNPALAYTPNPNTYIGSTQISAYTTEACPSQINFKNGKVIFNLAGTQRSDIPGYKSLDNIQVFDYDYESNQYLLARTIVFYDSYFMQGTDTTTKRLRLDSLSIIGNDALAIQTYRFAYNPLSLPVQSSKSRDIWGYYNGKANDMLIPQQQVEYIPGANGSGQTTPQGTIQIGSSVPNSRDVDTGYNQACMLNKIYYPTGGYSAFTFETNRYLNQGVITLAGGLRIKSIAHYSDPSLQPTLTTYQYDQSRVNFRLPDYSWVNNQEFYQIITQDVEGPTLNSTKRVRTFVANPNIDIIPYDAAPVVYPIVTEYMGDANINTGKTVYKFRDFQDGVEVGFAKPVVESHAYQRGQLLSKLVYRNNGNLGYQLLHDEENTYTAFPQNQYAMVGFSYRKIGVLEGSGIPVSFDMNSIYKFGNYSIFSDDNYSTSQVITDYDQNDPTKSLSKSISYNYGNIIHQQITKERMMDSKGNTHVITSKYPADYLNGLSTGSPVLDTMLNNNMQAPVIEKWDSLIAGTYSGVINGQIDVYKQITPGVIKLDNRRKLELLNTITDFAGSTITAGVLQYDYRYSPLVTMNSYDSYSNLAQYTGRDGLPMAFIWDYKGVFPIAKAENAVALDIAYTSFEAEGKGNWSFSGVSQTDASAFTGGKLYQLSSGSISKTGLSASKNYIISYWTKNVVAFSIAGTITGFPLKGKTVGAWTYFEHKISGQTSITLSGTGIVDELRLYPDGSRMSTYSYHPMVGLTGQCDINNRATYYDYDGLQRLMDIKDQDGNIIKTYQYHYNNYQKF